ncbi:MAG TPA: hypothetical protein VH496_11195 [Mycobacterium sp.]|jgi:hypothetical protein
MTEKRCLRGTDLRYVLTHYLQAHGPMTIAQLTSMLEQDGFETAGRASKAISDALRWEVRRGRVGHGRRGRYGPGWMPRSTEHRIRKRVLALRGEAQRLAAGSGHVSVVPTS